MITDKHFLFSKTRQKFHKTSLQTPWKLVDSQYIKIVETLLDATGASLSDFSIRNVLGPYLYILLDVMFTCSTTI